MTCACSVSQRRAFEGFLSSISICLHADLEVQQGKGSGSRIRMIHRDVCNGWFVDGRLQEFIMQDYKFHISTFWDTLSLSHPSSLDLTCKKAFNDTCIMWQQILNSSNPCFITPTHPNLYYLLYFCTTEKVFSLFHFFPGLIFLFLLETSELVLDGEGCFLRLRRLQVNVDLFLLLLRLCCWCFLWRDWGEGG